MKGVVQKEKRISQGAIIRLLNSSLERGWENSNKSKRTSGLISFSSSNQTRTKNFRV